MGNPKAFYTIDRKEAGYRPVHERISDFGEVEQTLNHGDRMLQASRCMDCGVPFCHWACPLGNAMPDYQDLLSKGKWKEAYEILSKTDDFPEFTGRVCPAPCEKSCVVNIQHVPVTIRENEASVTERAFMEGWITAQPPIKRSGKRVAVIGSGPAGLVAAFRLNRKGHSVTVFEKDEQAGGLLRFGIPNFKLNKAVIDRRLTLLEMEGIVFKTGVLVGEDVTYKELADQFDAVCLAIGAGKPRDLPVEGRDLKGVYFALDYLIDQNKQLAGITAGKPELNAKGKHVLVIGGGDTGSDCVGTANRQGAASVTQIEIMPKPPVGENPETPWPNYPTILKVSSSHEEGCTRRWALATKRFVGENGILTGVEIVEVDWVKDPNSGRMQMKETDNVEVLTVDMAFLAMGFVSPVHEGLLDQMEVAYDVRSNVAVNAQLQTSIEKVFAAGDVATGASLVVRAMASGRTMATCVHAFLTKK